MKRLALIALFSLVSLAGLSQSVSWQRVYGEGLYNECLGAREIVGQGYLLLQNQSSLSGNNRLVMTCTDTLGIIRWEKDLSTYGLLYGSDFSICPDKGYIITGYAYADTTTTYDLLLLKTDSAGTLEWLKRYGGNDWDFGRSVLITPDSGFLAIGSTYSYGPEDANVFLVKTNFSGDTLWTRTLGGDSLDEGCCGDITADSNYLIAANTNSFGHGDEDAWMLKMNPSGDLLFSEFYGDTLEDHVNSLMLMPDQGFVFVGHTRSYGAQETEIWLMRFDAAYQYMWKLPEFWNIGAAEDKAAHVALNHKGQYLISGYTTGAGNGGREMLAMVMAEWNDFKYSNTFGSLEDEEVKTAFQTSDLGYLVTGYTSGLGPSNTNVYVIKTDSTMAFSGAAIYTTGIEASVVPETGSLSVFPNPASDILNLRLANEFNIPETPSIRMFDMCGREVAVNPLTEPSADGVFRVRLGHLPQGVYLMEVRTREAVQAVRIIIHP